MNGAPGIVLGKGNLDRSMQARERDALDERVSIYMCVCRTYRLKATLTTYIYTMWMARGGWTVSYRSSEIISISHERRMGELLVCLQASAGPASSST